MPKIVRHGPPTRKKPWQSRHSSFLYRAVEKAFMVWLVLSNVREPFVSGFWAPFVVD
jgi:hypothetical protein